MELSPFAFPTFNETSTSPFDGPNLISKTKDGLTTRYDHAKGFFRRNLASEVKDLCSDHDILSQRVLDNGFRGVSSKRYPSGTFESTKKKNLEHEVPMAPTGELMLSQFFSGGLFRNPARFNEVESTCSAEISLGRPKNNMSQLNEDSVVLRTDGLMTKSNNTVYTFGKREPEFGNEFEETDFVIMEKSRNYHEDSTLNDNKLQTFQGRPFKHSDNSNVFGRYGKDPSNDPRGFEFAPPYEEEENDFRLDCVNDIASHSGDGIGPTSPPSARLNTDTLPSRKPADVFAVSDLLADVRGRSRCPVSCTLPATGPTDLRPVSEIPKKYRHLFPFSRFNVVQSRALDDALYTDRPMVIGAPTGSGKTVVFELAILRLLLLREIGKLSEFKVVYMAPIKALVSERHEDWQGKFSPHGLRSCELTGDSDLDDYYELSNVHLVLTTPEKWDFMTRRWRQNRSLVRQVRLFLVDEVHALADESRGATLEAVVNRMKTVVEFESGAVGSTDAVSIRFMAASATIPNISDLAEWLGSGRCSESALHYQTDESQRPVPLRKVVLGYDRPRSSSAFKFDLALNYRLPHVLELYSEMKPALVFCSTRKGTVQAAQVLAREMRYTFRRESLRWLESACARFRDSKLSELVPKGIAYHHAGLDAGDRKSVEELFVSGRLAVLLSTSTLAMGVNLPAHLVVVKSTQHYVAGEYIEYGESQVLQMIGRAGRPQFDTSATAVIMTQSETKGRYESLLNGTQLVESSLHRHLIEHLNAEIVLETVTDVPMTLRWIESSYLHVRIHKNPGHYGIARPRVPSDREAESSTIERKLHDICLSNLDKLAGLGLVTVGDEGLSLRSTEAGRLMSRYCVAFETVKNFHALGGEETLEELLDVFCSSEEFKDVILRTNEKRILNELNKHKNKPTVRFPSKERVKTSRAKISCLVQAQLGCLPLQDFALQQDTNKIFRCAPRIARCLVDMLWNKPHFRLLHSAVLLSKCLRAKLWENSRFVVRQLSGIGLVMATALVNNGVTSFEALLKTNPRNLELMVNRQPPFGNSLQEGGKTLPRYDLRLSQTGSVKSDEAEIRIDVCLTNAADISTSPMCGPAHTCVLLVATSTNHIVCKVRIKDSFLMQQGGHAWANEFLVRRSSGGQELTAHLVSQDWVGLDQSRTFEPTFSGVITTASAAKTPKAANSAAASAASKTPKRARAKQDRGPRNEYERCLELIKSRQDCFIPVSPAFKRLKTGTQAPRSLSDFSFQRRSQPFMTPAGFNPGGCQRTPLVPYSSGSLRRCPAQSYRSNVDQMNQRGSNVRPQLARTDGKRFTFASSLQLRQQSDTDFYHPTPTQDDLLLVAASEQAVADHGIGRSSRYHHHHHHHHRQQHREDLRTELAASDENNFDLVNETSFFEDENEFPDYDDEEEEEEGKDVHTNSKGTGEDAIDGRVVHGNVHRASIPWHESQFP